MLNARGEEQDLCNLFKDTVKRRHRQVQVRCAAPKLLQYAYRNGWQPLAMAEFWWGDSPKTRSAVMDIIIRPAKEMDRS